MVRDGEGRGPSLGAAAFTAGVWRGGGRARPAEAYRSPQAGAPASGGTKRPLDGGGDRVTTRSQAISLGWPTGARAGGGGGGQVRSQRWDRGACVGCSGPRREPEEGRGPGTGPGRLCRVGEPGIASVAAENRGPGAGEGSPASDRVSPGSLEPAELIGD